MMRELLPPAMALLVLAACSLIEPPPPAKEWNRATGDPDQTSADLNSCRAEAEAVQRRNAAIDRDIEAATEPVAPGTEPELLTRNLDAYEQQRRYDRMVANCMRARGYVLPEKEAI